MNRRRSRRFHLPASRGRLSLARCDPSLRVRHDRPPVRQAGPWIGSKAVHSVTQAREACQRALGISRRRTAATRNGRAQFTGRPGDKLFCFFGEGSKPPGQGDSPKDGVQRLRNVNHAPQRGRLQLHSQLCSRERAGDFGGLGRRRRETRASQS